MSYVAEAITEQWGDRCPDFNPECSCCLAWQEFDLIQHHVTRIEELETANRKLHRRAQIAEGVRQAIAGDLEAWIAVLSKPYYDSGRWLFSHALGRIERELARHERKFAALNRDVWQTMDSAPKDREILLDVSYWYPDDKDITACFVVASWDDTAGLWTSDSEGRRTDQINAWMDIPVSALPSRPWGVTDDGRRALSEGGER